jgi:hypothetical protein
MTQRRRLTAQEREEVGAEARKQNPEKRIFVQEWTNFDGQPIIVAIRDQ